MMTFAAPESTLCFITFCTEEARDATRTRFSMAIGISSGIQMSMPLGLTRCFTICRMAPRKVGIPILNLTPIGYRVINPDVSITGLNPLGHYIQYGIFHGWAPNLQSQREHSICESQNSDQNG